MWRFKQSNWSSVFSSKSFFFCNFFEFFVLPGFFLETFNFWGTYWQQSCRSTNCYNFTVSTAVSGSTSAGSCVLWSEILVYSKSFSAGITATSWPTRTASTCTNWCTRPTGRSPRRQGSSSTRGSSSWTRTPSPPSRRSAARRGCRTHPSSEIWSSSSSNPRWG